VVLVDEHFGHLYGLAICITPKRVRDLKLYKSTEKDIKIFLSPDFMGQTQKHYPLRPGIFPIIFFLILAGCIPVDRPEIVSPNKNTSTRARISIERLMNENLCGGLHLSKPVFNVTGHVTAPVTQNSSIFLFLSRDMTSESVEYAVHNCRPIVKQKITDAGRFQFGPLPAGKYVIMVHNNSFKEDCGLPLLHEFNKSNHMLDINFYMGDTNHSLVSFSIRPLP